MMENETNVKCKFKDYEIEVTFTYTDFLDLQRKIYEILTGIIFSRRDTGK